jgi:uncharacterized protein YbjT (DUF2867 family)
MRVLVTGGTGRVGSVLLSELLKRGTDVRVLARSASVESRLPSTVEIVQGDLLDPVSVARALEGVDKLFLLNAVVADELTQALIAYGVAKRMQIRHVVYLSVFKVDQFSDVPHFASKLAVERALRDGDVPFTILRPGYYFQNDLNLKTVLIQAGLYPMPIGTAGIAAVDVRDIAEAAAVALTTQGHDGQTYDLVGPGLLSGSGAATLWSELLGKPVRYPGEDFDQWEQQMRNNSPGWAAHDLRMMFQGYVERGFASTEAEVERFTKLLGHAPHSYERFARATAKLWGS